MHKWRTKYSRGKGSKARKERERLENSAKRKINGVERQEKRQRQRKKY